MKKLSVLHNGVTHTYNVLENTNLMTFLQESGIYIPAICSGRGTCGKCQIKVLDGALPVTIEDENFYSKDMLEAGYRLSCKAVISEDLGIMTINSDESKFEILTSYDSGGEANEVMINSGFSIVSFKEVDLGLNASDTLKSKCEVHVPLSVYQKIGEVINENDFYALLNEKRMVDVFPEEQEVYGVAVDIGTTTIGLELLNLITGKRLAAYSLINKQREFGADVISRIVSAREGKLNKLSKSVQRDIYYGIEQLAKIAGVRAKNIYNVVIAANTTMIHLLTGVLPNSLGVYPFRTTITDMEKFMFRDLFKGLEDKVANECVTTLLPSISAYVGADITSGIVFVKGKAMDKTSLLIDIGTNGEMALFGGDLGGKVLCTSTAAGPAFEGGNISCGIGSVPGAISKVSLENGEFKLTTIGDAKPIGICGSGVMDLVACLIRNEWVDETGIFDDRFDGKIELTDGVTFLQKDIRELQLAKSAIRAGLDILIEKAGLTYENIGNVFLAGGFGFRMNIESAVTIGLIPAELKEKIVSVGNSSLGGAVKALLNISCIDQMVNVTKDSEEISLSTDPRFNTLFMNNMYF